LSCERISPDWAGKPCVVAASGPSLTPDAVWKIRQARWFNDWRVIVVNDAFKRLPRADILYAADLHWWRYYEGAKDFYGQRWCCRDFECDPSDERKELAEKFGLRLVGVKYANGFSRDDRWLHTGDEGHSGFQAVNLALLLGCPKVVLIGFDMRRVDGQTHFFGEHPGCLRPWMQEKEPQAYYASFVRAYRKDERIVNATPDSALKVYPFVELDDALRWDNSLYRDRAVADAGSDRDSAA
jgi:hypothetical protein